MTESVQAWLFDILPQKNAILTYWITNEHKTIQCYLKQVYCSMYAISITNTPLETIYSSLLSHPDIINIRTVKKRVSIHDQHYSDVLEFQVPMNVNKQKFIHEIRDIFPLELYNVDLSDFQYLYQQTGLFPFCKTVLVIDATRNIQSFEVIDQLTAFNYELPPVKAVQLDIEFTSVIKKEKIKSITFTSLASNLADETEEKYTITSSNERDLILDTLEWISDYDPDVLVTHGGDQDLRLFATRAVAHGLGSLSLSREASIDPLYKAARYIPKGTSFMSYGGHFYKDHGYYLYGGRQHVDLRNSFTWKDGGFAGTVELARLSCIDAQRCARTSIGTNLTGMQIRQALMWDILIPSRKADSERFRSGETLVVGDRGGFIYSPRVGLHFNVASIDFSSMFPELMVKKNISPETVNCDCCADGSGRPIPGTTWYTCQKRKGLVPLVLKTVLIKRLFYKKFKKINKSYDQLQKTLKWVLVTSFGYQGYRNARFGRIEAHESINAYARECLLIAGEILQKYNFELIAGIVDSLWGKYDDEHAIDGKLIDQICQEIEEATELPIANDGIYRWIVFLPRRHEPGVGVLNRYYGCFEDGSFKVRGIELRRRDTCDFIRTAQAAALDVLAPATSNEEFFHILRTDFWTVHEKFDVMLLKRDVPVEQLFITKVIAKEPKQYVQSVHQAIAAQQLAKAGLHLQSGMKITFLVTNSTAKSTSKRVIAKELYNGEFYDLAWYRKMLREAFTNIIPPIFTDKKHSSLSLHDFITENKFVDTYQKRR